MTPQKSPRPDLALSIFRLFAVLPLAGLALFSLWYVRIFSYDPYGILHWELQGVRGFAGLAAAAAFGWLALRGAIAVLRMHVAPEEYSPWVDLLTGVGALLGVLMALLFFAVREIGPRHRSEGSAKGNLGAVRSALSIYYGDMEGYYPLTLDALTESGKYISTIPKVDTLGLHPRSSRVTYGARSDDDGGWLYANDPADKAHHGTLWINCTHTDPRGAAWTSY